MGGRTEGTKMGQRMNKFTKTDQNGRPLQMILDEYEIKKGEDKNVGGRFLECKLVRGKVPGMEACEISALQKLREKVPGMEACEM